MSAGTTCTVTLWFTPKKNRDIYTSFNILSQTGPDRLQQLAPSESLEWSCIVCRQRLEIEIRSCCSPQRLADRIRGFRVEAQQLTALFDSHARSRSSSQQLLECDANLIRIEI